MIVCTHVKRVGGFTFGFITAHHVHAGLVVYKESSEGIVVLDFYFYSLYTGMDL